MSTQHTQPDFSTQDLIDRISSIFQPQLTDIKRQLNEVVTRREHDKDIAELAADITALRRDHDRIQDWADKRPRESADADWVKRLEADIRMNTARMAQQPAEAREWFATFTQGGGCLAAVVMACIAIGGIMSSAAVSIIIALVFHP